MRITCRTEALLIGLALLLTAIEPAVAIDNVVLQWNERRRLRKLPIRLAYRGVMAVYTLKQMILWAARQDG